MNAPTITTAPAADPSDPYARTIREACAYAARGWHVFPLVPHEKRPAVTRWEARATTDPARIERAWSTRTDLGPYGVGIACGPSQLLVVDLDTPKPATTLSDHWARPGVVDGADVLAVLATDHAHPTPLDTYTVHTPSGGTHLYFTAPDPHDHTADDEDQDDQHDGARDGGCAGEQRPLGNTAGALGPLVDTRGRGGYVVAPPTVLPTHVHGIDPREGDGLPRHRAYVAVHPGAPAAPLPAWLVDLLQPKPLPPQQPVTVRLTPGLDGTAPGSEGVERARRYVQAAVDRTLAAVLDAAPGTRNRALYGAAVSLGQLIAGGALDPDSTTAALIAAGTAVGQSERAATATVRSGLRAGAARPRTILTRPTNPSNRPTPGAAA